jgi:flagellar assembly protein FliH
MALRPPTAEDLDAIHQQAYDEGFSLGRKEGRAQGHQETRDDWERRIHGLRQVLDALAEPLRDLDQEVESTLIDLVVLVARQLIRRELKTSPGEIVAALREALPRLPMAARHPRIHMHPDDIELVRDALGLDEDQKAWRLEPDPRISRGGCLVETESSFIDATVEARLSAAIARMLGGEREGDRHR